ncbi:MAG: hypothetical protein QOK05_1749 [Chloroflexota bacterium]|nr:hypothetical protein [Chloroflexota bacterium]
MDLALLYATALRHAGHDVATAVDGQQALQLLNLYNPDIIILDMRMPVLDGLATLAGIRSSETLAHIPVMVFTNTDLLPSEVARLEDLGIEAWMTKISMQPADLNGWLRRWSDGRGLPVRRSPPERGPRPG